MYIIGEILYSLVSSYGVQAVPLSSMECYQLDYLPGSESWAVDNYGIYQIFFHKYSDYIICTDPGVVNTLSVDVVDHSYKAGVYNSQYCPPQCC